MNCKKHRHLRVSPKDPDLSEAIQNRNVVEIIKSEDYGINWKYGHPKLRGRGNTFYIHQPDSSWQEVGNIIRMENNGLTVGYEFGFGVEALAGFAAQRTTPLICHSQGANNIMNNLQGTTREVEKLADCAIAAAIATTTTEADSSQRGRLYYKVLRNLY